MCHEPAKCHRMLLNYWQDFPLSLLWFDTFFLLSRKCHRTIKRSVSLLTVPGPRECSHEGYPNLRSIMRHQALVNTSWWQEGESWKKEKKTICSKIIAWLLNPPSAPMQQRMGVLHMEWVYRHCAFMLDWWLWTSLSTSAVLPWCVFHFTLCGSLQDTWTLDNPFDYIQFLHDLFFNILLLLGREGV